MELQKSPSLRDIIVETKDTLGNVNTEAAKATLWLDETVTAIAIDDENNRLFGTRYTSNRLFTVDLDTGEREEQLMTDSLPYGVLVYAQSEGVLVSGRVLNGELSMDTIDVETGHVRPLFNYSVPKTSGEWVFTHFESVDYSSSENALYVLMNMVFSDVDDATRTHLIKYDFSDDEITVIADGETPFETLLFTNALAVTESGLHISNHSYLGQYHYKNLGIQNLTLDGQSLSQLTPQDIDQPLLLTSDPTNSDRIISVAFEGVTEINTVTGEIRVVSEESDQDDLFFSQVRDADLDLYNNRLLVVDSDLQMVVAVDMESGQRSRYMHEGVGLGKAMITPYFLGLDETNHRLYVADDGGNAPEALLAIDLTTGNRTEVGSINQQFNEFIEDLVIDAQGQKAYVAFGRAILSVDLQTNETVEIASANVGSGADFGQLYGLALDRENNRLLVSDTNNRQILAIDLTTKERVVLSSAEGNVGSGDSFWVCTPFSIRSGEPAAYSGRHC